MTGSPQAPDLGSSRIAQIAVRVLDIDRSIAFYRDVLGLKFLFAAPPKMAFFDCGGIRLLLGEPTEGDAEHFSSVLYFEVGDIQAVHATLLARGVEVQRPPHVVHKGEGFELWLSEFRDPDGNPLALMATRRT